MEKLNDMQEWQWPGELDALIAAPKHHNVLLENEFVRVLDTCIGPGEKTEIHTHKFPAVLYILSWSDFIRYDHTGNVMLDSRTLEKIPSPKSALWSASLVPHYVENIGKQNLHVISVEIKK
jgi:hypothetical protein